MFLPGVQVGHLEQRLFPIRIRLIELIFMHLHIVSMVGLISNHMIERFSYGEEVMNFQKSILLATTETI